MIPVLGPGGGRSTSLPEGQASPLVCSEIASLAGARHQEAAVRALATFSQSQTPRRTKSRQDAAMAWLQGPFLCGALLGWVCLSGKEGASERRWEGAGPEPGRRRRRPLGGWRTEEAAGPADKLGLSGGCNHHPTFVFLSPTSTPSDRAQSWPFQVLPPEEPVVCGLLPPGNLRLQEGRDGAEGVEPQGKKGTPATSPERFSRRPFGHCSPRAGRGGEGAHRAPERAGGQDRRADVQLQHVGGRQLRPGVELRAAWEARLLVPTRELRAPARNGGALLPLAGLVKRGRNRGPTQR